MNPPGYAANGIHLTPEWGREVYSVFIYNAAQCRGLLHPPANLDLSKQEEIEEWLVENCPSRLADVVDYTTAFWRARFTEFKDALAFFLRWG